MNRLAERRERLISLAASQRIALAESIEPWRTPLAIADRGLEALRYLKRHPGWIVAGAATLVALRPVPIGKWLRRGWAAWLVMRKLRGRR